MSGARGLFAGLATLDVIHAVEHVPGANEKLAAAEFSVAAGGPAANAAVAFAACGGHATLVTALPQHALADVVRADLASCGVDVSAAAEYEGPPVTASILVTRATGERAIVSASGVATSANPGPLVAPPGLDGVGAVLIDGYFRAISLPLAHAARAAGVPVILDGGSFKDHTEELLAVVDVAVVSADFAPPGTGGEPDAVVAYLVARGVERVVITRGASPIFYRTPESSGEVAVAATSVVDTLGAGDFFHGALAWRVADLGWDDARLPDDLAFASSVAARSIGSFGTRDWLVRIDPASA